MIKVIDNFLNDITMYRVILYGLLVLAVIALLFSVAGALFYTPTQLLTSFFILITTCFITNTIFSKILKAPTNVESYFITALILFFLYMPVTNRFDGLTVVAAGIIAMASKYLLAINKKHLFNPAAFSAFILGMIGNGNALWWVGSDILLPFVFIIGLLIVRKIRRFHLFFSFIITSVITIIIFGLLNKIGPHMSIQEAFTSWPLVFFATIMLTEPLTMPPTKKLQMVYGTLVGILFGSQFHFGPFYSTPEFALVIGNIFSYIVSPKQKLLLHLTKKIKITDDIYEFAFNSNQKLHFKAGQYLEWTLPHPHPDTRGNRRYFTIASSPTEETLRLGIRVSQNASSYKRTLISLEEKNVIIGSQLAGDFTLPEKDKKLVFIAGGIGITPFRSMIKYLIDKKEKRQIILLYVNKKSSDIAYKDIFDTARDVIGLKTVYILTDKHHVPPSWKGRLGRIDEKILIEEIPDYQDRVFYLSGPNAMVDSYKKLLSQLGIKMTNIKTDYFPGF